MSVTIMINNARASDPELNLANGNFFTLDSALGVFDEEWCGSMSPQHMLNALRTFDPDLAVRAEQREYGDGGELHYVNCALPREQVDRYVQMLTLIANEALRRGEMIVWC